MFRAAEWLFSHPDDSGDDNIAISTNTSSVVSDHSESNGKYTLQAIISHLGKSVDCGHYICHVKKDDKWVLFNDEKVARSENPPFGFGFMYLYKRDD